MIPLLVRQDEEGDYQLDNLYQLHFEGRTWAIQNKRPGLSISMERRSESLGYLRY